MTTNKAKSLAWYKDVPQRDGSTSHFEVIHCPTTSGSSWQKYIETGETPDVVLYCASVYGWTTLTACEKLCPRYYSCDNVAVCDDYLCQYEGGKEQ